MKTPGILKILCIDDDADLLETLSAFLRHALQATVQTASTVPDAITAIREHGPFDVLVSDYQLAPHTALDLLHHLRVKKIDSKLVLYSGHSAINETLFQGDSFLGVIQKPDHRLLLKLLQERFNAARL